MISAIIGMVLVSAVMTMLCFYVNTSFVSEVLERAESDQKMFGIVLKDNDYGQFVIAFTGTLIILFISNMVTILLYLLAYGK